MTSFGQIIKRARFNQLLSLKEAANKMGICKYYLCRIESERSPPTIGLIKSSLRCGFLTEEESKEFIKDLFNRKNKSK